MADKSLAIRLSLKDADQVRNALKQTFGDGSVEVRKFEQSLAPTSRALEGIRNAVDSTRRPLQQIATQIGTLNAAFAAGKVEAGEYGRLLDQLNAKAANLQNGGRAAAGGLSAISAALGPLGIALSAAFAVDKVLDFAKAMVTAGDTVTRLEGRFLALTGSATASTAAVRQVFDITAKTGAAVEDTAQAFTQFFLAGQSIGATQAESARLVETIQKLGVVGGASMQSMIAGSRQLAQGLAADRFAGDEFKSVMENMPLVARALADALGVSIGKLREMSEAGELTAERVFGALTKKAGEADKQFADIPVTVDRAAGQAAAAWTQFSAALDKSIGLSRVLAGVLQGIAAALRDMSKPSTGENIAAGLRQQIANQERIASENRAGGKEGEARRNDANIARMREALRLAEGMATAEQEAASAIWVSEQAAAAAAKAEAARTKELKEQTAARTELNKVLSSLDPKFKAAATFSDAVMELDKAFQSNSITVEEHARYVGLAVKAYDEAVAKADKVKTSVDRVGNAFKNQLASIIDSTVALAGMGATGEREFAALTQGATQFAQGQVTALTAARNLNEVVKQTQGLNKSSVALGNSITGRQVDADAAAYLKAVKIAEQYEGQVARLSGAIRQRGVDTADGAAAQQLLTATELQWIDAGKQVGETLANITRKRDDDLAKLADRVQAGQDQNAILKLEIEGSDDSAAAIVKLKQQRVVERLEVERRLALGPVMARLANDEVKASAALTEVYRDQAAAINGFYDDLVAAESQRPFLERQRDLAKEAADAFQQPFSEAARAIQSTLADTFENIFSGGIRSFKDLGKSILDIFIKLAAQIAALMVFQPAVRWVGAGLGLGSETIRALGGGAVGSSTSAGGGMSMPSLGGLNLGGSGTIGNFLSTPIFGGAAGTGAPNAAGFIGAGGTLGDEFGGMVGGLPSGAATGGLTYGGALGLAGAGLSVFNAVQNPNIGTIGGAALTTFGAAAGAFPAMFGSLAALGPYGMIAGAVLSILGNTLFKKKPSNLGAESSFTFDQLEAGAELDFDRLYRSTKHKGSLSLVDNIALAGQDTLGQLAKQFDDVVFGGTISARYGRKEGASISYGAPDATSVADWQEFKFDYESEEEAAQAYADLSLAALKAADWSALGETVASAVANSAAPDLEAFLADVDFAKGFDTTVEFLNKGWDPVTSQMAQLTNSAKEGGKAFADTVTSFLDKTNELWPGITRSFDEAGNEIAGTVETVTRTLTAGAVSYSQEVDQTVSTLADATGAVYTFTGTLGDATLTLTDSAGQVSTATFNASTGVYELATSVETLGGTVASTTTELSEQQVLAGTAAKNFGIGMLGLTESFRYVNENGIDVLVEGTFAATRPLSGLGLALEESRLRIESYRDGLIDAGMAIDDVNRLIAASITHHADVITAQFARIDAAAAASIQASINQAINPAWQPSAQEVLVGQGLDPTQYARLLGLMSAAATGDAAALQGVGERLTYNLNDQALRDAGLALTQQQVDALLGYTTGAYTRARAPQAGGYEPANDSGSGSVTSGGGSSGGGSSSGDSGERQAIQDAIGARRDEQRTIEQSISSQERLRDSYLQLAERMSKFRQSLLVSDLSPLTPEQQLAEARRQYEGTLAKAMGGDQDAVQDLESVTRTFLEKSGSYWASSSGQLTKSTRYQEDFARVQADLLKVEGKARDYQAEAVAQLVTLNGTLATVKTAIENLEIDLGAVGGGGGGGVGGGGGGGGGGGSTPTPTTPAAGYYVNQAGVLTQIKFGMAGLGRGANESISSFMPKNFKSYTGALTEEAAYAWMLEPHPSGLSGLDRLEYFVAARRAKFPASLAFGGRDHENWLNADATKGRWRDFIDQLRAFTTVVPGFFAYAGAPTDYARGGIFDGGNVVPFPGVWKGITDQPTLFDIGRMGERGPEGVVPLVQMSGGGYGVRSQGGGSDPAIARGLARLEERLARIESELQEDKIQRAAATRTLAAAADATTEAVRRNRPPLIDAGPKRRMTV